MKKQIFLLCLISSVIITLIGCVKEDETPIDKTGLLEEEDLHEVVFHAGWAQETKTVLKEDGSVWWTPGDSIALFMVGGSGIKKYCLKADCKEPAQTTNFIGKIGEESGTYYAIYPYNNAGEWLSRFTIPMVQYAKAGGFAPGQFVSFTRSDNKDLTFYNVCAGIKFSVAHEGISKVVFKSRQNSYPIITGEMGIPFYTQFPDTPDIVPVFNSDDPSVSESDVSNTLTVYPAEGKYFIPGEYYYASIRPGYTSLVVSFYTDEQVATTSLPGGIIERSKIAVLQEKDKDLTFEQDYNYSYSLLGPDILPEGIEKTAIRDVIFHTSSDVTTSTVVPSSIPSVDGRIWQDYIPVYFELKGTTAHYYSKAERYLMTGPECISFQGWRELRSVDLSMFCTNQVTDFSYMFNSCVKLESVNLSSFNTSSAQRMTGMFSDCKSLKGLDLRSFSSRSLVGFEPAAQLFAQCYDLVKLDLGNFDLSNCDHFGAMIWFAKFSKNCAIRCNAATRLKLSDSDSQLGSSADYITWVLPEEDIPDLEPIVDPTLYTSTDYSKDKTVRILHQATKGNGVDIVLLGDGYSDRMIADGTYDADMELAMNAILKDEPYASFKDYINVYTVYAVSKNEIPFSTRTAFDVSINQWDPVAGIICSRDEYEVYRYASIAFPNKDLEDIAMIIIINQAEGDGDSFTDGVAVSEGWWSNDDYLDYAAHAKSIGMINRRDRSQTKTFSEIVAHEFGHVFAKLGDEYVMFNGSQIPDWERNAIVDAAIHVGWWSNIDVTNDPQKIKWKRFLEDERYSGTGIGIFAGGYTYSDGVWHPSENSIMRFNTGGFNAPSREVIYKRIHKLALGKDWQYDYETFVEYDQKNIEAEKAAQTAQVSQSTAKIPYPARVNRKHLFKMEESTTADGKKKVTVIMN
ncbi:MAG: BspA family leucine-rich repeat surface protein [Bacteroidales bacterium]|nr:BspA family leucine-rich repeat surface protein [Bacteroidales bacterium]